MSLDPYGGYPELPVPGGATGFFRLGRLGHRSVFATPEGNAFWMRSVYECGAMDPRFRQWGFNALGEYTNLHALPIATYNNPPNADPLPFIWPFNASNYAFESGTVKNLYRGIDVAQNPTIWIGKFLDVFSPSYATYIEGHVSDAVPQVFGGAANLDACPWLIGITTDDSDYTTGFGPGPESEASQGKIHPHLGWVVAVMAPTQRTLPEWEPWEYPDPVVYSKRVWRDGLAEKYGVIGNLNAAWGSNYTTFDSDGGWPAGRGLLDENGKGPWLGSDGNHLMGASPATLLDLDNFIGRLADAYFSAYATAVRRWLPHHLLFTPMSMQAMPRRPILESAGRYVDAIQTGGVPGGPSYPFYRQMYDIAKKPLFVWTNFTAQQDCRVENPDSGWGPAYDKPTQAERGAAYAAELAGLLSLRASDGAYPIIGIDWYSERDKTVGGERMNFGLKDGAGEPYAPFVDAASQSNASVFDALQGSLPPAEETVTITGKEFTLTLTYRK